MPRRAVEIFPISNVLDCDCDSAPNYDMAQKAQSNKYLTLSIYLFCPRFAVSFLRFAELPR